MASPQGNGDFMHLLGIAPLTGAQVGCFLMYGVSLALMVVAEAGHWMTRRDNRLADDPEKAAEKSNLLTPKQQQQPEKADEQRSFIGEFMDSGFFKVLSLNAAALEANRKYITATVEFGTLMMWFFIADRTNMLPEGSKAYSRDTFFFVYGLLVVYSFTTHRKEFKLPVLLNRFQTEEWKGWMQVLFLLYHYFEARELYNLIRVLIAAYVWMTGFGNFLYYYKTRDFSVGRFAEMMWRLNFLVLFCCLMLNNSYMLYYICPMHTIFTVFVYAVLAIFPTLNDNRMYLLGKILASGVFIYLLWDVKAVFYTVWKPFTWLVGYTDPRRPGDDNLHEWYFRSGLDRYVWIYGMLCGFVHPYVDSMFNKIDGMAVWSRYSCRALIFAIGLAVGTAWYHHVYVLGKYDYNAIHPYTSWIPITVWIFWRNLTPYMRTFSLGIFGWLGCITLETYMGQFHTWLSTSIADGQPVGLLELVPGYPMVNFMVVTAVYVFVSYRLFLLTNILKQAAVPGRDAFKCGVNASVMMLAGGFFLAAGQIISVL